MHISMRKGCVVFPFAYKSLAENAYLHLLDCVIEKLPFLGVRLHHKIRQPDKHPWIYTAKARKLGPKAGYKKSRKIRPAYLIVPAGGRIGEEFYELTELAKIQFMTPQAVALALSKGTSLESLERPLAIAAGWPLYDGGLLWQLEPKTLRVVPRKPRTIAFT